MNSQSRKWFVFVITLMTMLAFAQSAWAATCTSNNSGDWKDNVWTPPDPCNSGSLGPLAGSTIVIANGTTIKVDSSTLVVANVTINSSGTLQGNAGNILTLAGNLTNNGTFNNGGGTVQLIAFAAQTITGSIIFDNLTLTNLFGVTISGNVTVNGTFLPGLSPITIQSGSTLIIGGTTYTGPCSGIYGPGFCGGGNNGGSAGACGPIPIISSGTGPVFAGTSLEVSQNVKVNNGSYANVNSGNTNTNQVVPTPGGAPTTVATTLPPLQPAAFPATSGTYSIPQNGNGSLTAPQYLNSLTLGSNATLTLAPGDYYIHSLFIDQNATVNVSPAGKVRIFTDDPNVTIGQNVSINKSPYTGDAGNFMLLLYGAVDLKLNQNVTFVGIIYAPSTSAKIEVENNSNIIGGIVTGGKAELKQNVVLTYTPTVQSQLASASTCAASALDHVQLNHTGAGVTCIGSSVTINACNGTDSGGICTTNTSGLTGNVIAKNSSGVTLVTVPFTIASGNSSTTVSVPITTAQTVTLATSSLSVTPTNTGTCWDGSTASCNHIYSNAGFIFTNAIDGAVANILPQVAGTSSGIYYLRAVKTNTTTKACDVALKGANTVSFAYECNNPSTCSPSNLMSINGGTATTIARNNNGSVTNYTSVSMSFDANGNAPLTFDLDDVGAVTLYASKAADSTLLTALTGSSNSFVVAPAAFSFSGITAAPIKAGKDFSATVTALTSTGATTPNFGKESSPESVTLSFTKYQPTGTGAVNGLFSGMVGVFSNGSATANNLNWSEVGTIDITATLTSNSYLGSGLTATGVTGTTGAVGRFIPDHFDTVVSEDTCTDGFTYSGQPFTVTVTAKNGLATPTTTLNYDGSINTTPNFAKAVTLSDANTVTGSLTPSGMVASAFTAGVANAMPAFTFTTKLTAPATIKLRAIDTDNASSATASEGTATIRSGRLRLFNAFGSEKANLNMPVQSQYWSGKSWVLNNTDTCTSLPANAVNLISAPTGTSVNAAIVIINGQGTLTLTKPNPVATGSVDVAANLGASGSDQSCLASHGGTAADMSWLRSQNGNCAATYDRDPSARATFGIYSAETKRTIHVREQF